MVLKARAVQYEAKKENRELQRQIGVLERIVLFEEGIKCNALRDLCAAEVERDEARRQRDEAERQRSEVELRLQDEIRRHQQAEVELARLVRQRFVSDLSGSSSLLGRISKTK